MLDHGAFSICMSVFSKFRASNASLPSPLQRAVVAWAARYLAG